LVCETFITSFFALNLLLFLVLPATFSTASFSCYTAFSTGNKLDVFVFLLLPVASGFFPCEVAEGVVTSIADKYFPGRCDGCAATPFVVIAGSFVSVSRPAWLVDGNFSLSSDVGTRISA